MLTYRVWKPGSEALSPPLSTFVAFFRKNPLTGTAQGTTNLAKRAKAIVGLYDNGTLVGTIGLKVPRKSWKAKLESKAHTTLPGLELGWLYIEPRYAGQGGAQMLITAALCEAGGKGVYYVAQEDHGARNVLLEHAGFVDANDDGFVGQCGADLFVLVKRGSDDCGCGSARGNGCSAPEAAGTV